ncbi:MAG: hypothetical protein OEW21_13375, partial [Betaproteobacteria bacterium]|nr:hypothetical protein [Betaproteobacteria bacterium]
MESLTLKEHKALLNDLHKQLEGNRKAIDDALETLTDLIDASEGRMWLARIKELRARYVVV